MMVRWMSHREELLNETPEEEAKQAREFLERMITNG